VKTPNDGHQISGIVYCASTLFVSKDFGRRSLLKIHEAKVKTPIRLAKKQRVTSSTIFDITFELSKHEFKRTF
jgi:hypothetical protein